MMAAIVCLATLGAVGENQWTLSTVDARLDLAIVDGQLHVTWLAEVGSDRNWILEPGAYPFMGRVWVDGVERPMQWHFSSASKSEDTLELEFVNDDPLVVLRSKWTAEKGRGPIEHRVEIENQSGQVVTIAHQDSLTLLGLKLEPEARIQWIKRGGSNASKQGGIGIEPLAPGLDLELVSNCDDGASPCPWLAVDDSGRRGLYVGWEFSGLGRLDARAATDAKSFLIEAGNKPEFKTDIAPGEVFLVPSAFVGCYAGDLDDGAYSLHQWILAHRPSVPANLQDPTLAYNLYLDAGGPKATEDAVRRSAQFCCDIGFETFMPDAMWFPACGDWRWDPVRFPQGIAPIEQFVHDRGMNLALWCAWSNGGTSEYPDSLNVRRTPEWFSSDFRARWKPGPFYGGRLCLACKEAREWAIQKTQWLVGHHKLDYLKHDCGPIITECNKTTHRHRYGVDASYWATMGYYEVQERLRAAFPDLILENCSGGGHIKDFGIMRRTHYTVTTDTLSNLPDRQSIWDSTFAFPPVVLQAYTYEWEYKAPGDDPGPFLWRSAMMGAWQIDPTRTRDWSAQSKESARRHAEIYKDWVRPILHDAKVHHILPRPDGTHWDGMFYWSPGLKKGTLYIFRPDAKEESQTVKLKGLDPALEYRVWSEDGSIDSGLRSGSELMDTGVSIHLPDRYTSDLVYLQEETIGQRQ